MTQSIEQRQVQEILQVRLDGAELWDVVQHIADKETAGEDPWTVDGDAAPLTAEQVDSLIRAADAIILGSYPDFPPELARDIAQRKNLLARSIQSGELAIAARLLKDIAQLEGVCPAKGAMPAPAINETKATLLLEIQRRHLAVADAPIPDDELFEHGPLFSATQWFQCGDGERMRWTRAMAELVDDGLVLEHRDAGAKWPNVRLSEDGQAILSELTASNPPTLKITA